MIERGELGKTERGRNERRIRKWTQEERTKERVKRRGEERR